MKTNAFRNLLSKLCTPVTNISEIPNTLNDQNKERISSIHFDDQKVIKLIRSLDMSKSYGLDEISIQILKIGDVAGMEHLLS